MLTKDADLWCAYKHSTPNQRQVWIMHDTVSATMLWPSSSSFMIDMLVIELSVDAEASNSSKTCCPKAICISVKHATGVL